MTGIVGIRDAMGVARVAQHPPAPLTGWFTNSAHRLAELVQAEAEHFLALQETGSIAFAHVVEDYGRAQVDELLDAVDGPDRQPLLRCRFSRVIRLGGLMGCRYLFSGAPRGVSAHPDEPTAEEFRTVSADEADAGMRRLGVVMSARFEPRVWVVR